MFPLPNKAQKVIIAPLNWGLGHATRCIPIIQDFLKQGKEVILASDGDALELLSAEFPQLDKIQLPAYNVKYKGQSLFSIVFNNSFNIFLAIVKEHFRLKSIVKRYKPDLVISDSRFGFWSKKTKTVFITHQLILHSESKLFGYFLNLTNRFFLKKFDNIWILDKQDHRLSGKLSQSNKFSNTHFIGPLTRLKKLKLPEKYSLAIILSGPEPARTKLEQKIVKVLFDYKQSVSLVRGTNVESHIEYPDKWIIYDRVGAEEINKIIMSSSKIISRSGYTSIMDYYLLEKAAVLIPTPGQSEQEYLAEYLNGKFEFVSIQEKNINLLTAYL